MARSAQGGGGSKKRLEMLREIGRKTARADREAEEGVPSWRRIEMLKERKALLDALDDPLLGLEVPEEAVFLEDSGEASRFYTRQAGSVEDEPPDLDDESDLD